MPNGKLDERQLHMQGKITKYALVFALTLLLFLSTLLEFTGDWMTPAAMALTVIWATIGFQTIAAIVTDAYFAPGEDMRIAKVLAGIIGIAAAINCGVVGISIYHGDFLEDGKLGTNWASLVATVAVLVVLAVGVWKTKSRD